MNTIRSFALASIVASCLATTGAHGQTGSWWRGVVDANIPMTFYAKEFTAESIEGRVEFGQARHGYSDINRLCDSARLHAVRQGSEYAYRIHGACRGKGTLRVTEQDPGRIEGRGTILDAAAASGYKRRHFYLVRE